MLPWFPIPFIFTLIFFHKCFVTIPLLNCDVIDIFISKTIDQNKNPTHCTLTGTVVQLQRLKLSLTVISELQV